MQQPARHCLAGNDFSPARAGLFRFMATGAGGKPILLAARAFGRRE
jgi:hypothetical protein